MRRARAVPVVVMVCACCLFCSCETANKVLDVVTPFLISDEQESKIGRNFYNQIVADTVSYRLYKKNQRVVDYVRGIGATVVSHQNDRPPVPDTFQYYFHVIDNDTVVNAFAIPGGHVFIYTGLLLNAQNEAEVAAVIAHEVAHIARRHGAKRLVEAYGMDFCLSLVFGDSTALRRAMDVATGLLFLKFSRENEYEADERAVAYMIACGYNPTAMVSFFQSLGVDSSGTARLFEPLSTHPRTEERIARVQTQIDASPNANLTSEALFADSIVPIKGILSND